MSTRLTTCNQAAVEIVAEACPRNTAAELHIQQPSGSRSTAWTRMLGSQNEVVQLDQPLAPVYQARQASKIRTDTAHPVGMQVVPWMGCEAKQMNKGTQRFVIAEQRCQLRRRR